MANSITNVGKDFLLQAGNWVAGNFNVYLVDNATFTYVPGTHNYLSDIPVIERVDSAALAGKTCVNGALDANDVVFASVTGDQFEYVIIVGILGGAETADPIICVFDTASGLPLTPNGNNITLTWNVGGIMQF